jgi:PBSX family phage terminase large subunit
VSIGLPSGKQAASIIGSNARINLWHGSVSSGKTVGSLIRFIDYCLTGPPGDLLAMGKTERTLKRNLLDPIEELIGPGIKMNRGTGEARIFGRRVYLAGANNEGAEVRIRGLTVAGAYCDEVTTWPESIFKMLLTRLRVPGAKMFGTTNPDAPTHWLKRDYIDRADELDMTVWHFTLDDNPFLDPAYVAATKAEFTGVWRQRFIEGLWVAAEGAVYDGLSTGAGGRHVVSAVPECDRYVLGIDYGTSNPFSALLIGIGRDDCLYVCREWVWDSALKHRQLTDGEYSARLGDWLDTGADHLLMEGRKALTVPVEDVIVDPSATSFRRQLAVDGWGWATPADNAVIDGIRYVSALLANDRLFIHESCEELIRELTAYHWDASAQKRGEDKPVKVDDHGPDALRYGVMGLKRFWSRWLTNEMKESA